MKFGFANHPIRSWGPPAFGVCAIVASCFYAISRQSRVESGIRELETVGATLGRSAGVLKGAVASPERLKEIRDRKIDLTARKEDARKPGLLQAELMQSARNVNLDVREILPVASTSGTVQSTGEFVYPMYRVSVVGTYRQIAEYIEACSNQRLPARVKSFRVSVATGSDGKPRNALLAEITVEGFLLPDAAGEESSQG